MGTRPPLSIYTEYYEEENWLSLNQILLFCSLVIIFFGGIGAANSNLSTLEFYLGWSVVLAVFLLTTFIEIRNLFPFLPWWHLGVGIAAGIALIGIISFGWPALLVVGIVLIIYAAIRWAKE